MLKAASLTSGVKYLRLVSGNWVVSHFLKRAIQKVRFKAIIWAERLITPKENLCFGRKL